MNVVHLMISGGIGGIEVLTKEISGLSEQNNIFYFLFGGGVIADKISESNPVFIADGNHINFVGEAVKFTKFCQENNADVIIAHNGAPIIRFIGAFAKKQIKNIKFLLYWHSNASIWFNYKSKIKNTVEKKIEKFAFQRCDNAVAISESVKNSFIDVLKLNENKIKVVYNGINLDKFSFREKQYSELFNITYVGRVFYQKGVHVLINAISYLPENCKIKLNVIGKYETDYGNQLKEIISQKHLENKVSLCGPQTNVDEWLASANLFVHPAVINEGFGITLAEAMACGIPCIAFDEGAMREIINNGKNGYIVENQTPEDMAKAIEKVYNLWQSNRDEYKEMCAYAHNSAQKFSIENTVAQLESLYK